MINDSNATLPPTASPEARFWDRHAAGYARRAVANQPAYRTKLDKTNGYLAKTDRVLEVGCGTGSTALVHAPQVAHYLASDLSSKMIEIARRKAAAAGLEQLEFEVAGIDDISAASGSLDVVLAHNVLHLLDDVPAALANLRLVLKPGGLLIASVTCIRDEMAWFAYIAPFGHRIGLLPLINAFDGETFDDWLVGAGFDVVERWLPGPKRGQYLVARASTG